MKVPGDKRPPSLWFSFSISVSLLPSSQPPTYTVKNQFQGRDYLQVFTYKLNKVQLMFQNRTFLYKDKPIIFS